MKTFLAILLTFISLTAFAQDGVPEFSGYVGTPTEETDNLFRRFNDFMLENEGNNVILNITLDDEQLDALRTPTDDFYFFAVYDNYSDKLSGIEYHIMKSKTPASFELNTSTNTIIGEFKIGNITGPQNGLLVVELNVVKKTSR